MIDQLLDKYYEGATSLEEEKLLAELLRKNDEPRYDADRRLICGIHSPMPDFGAMAARASRRRILLTPEFLRRLSVAASVAILVCIGVFFLKPSAPGIPDSEEEVVCELTVEEATEQARLALAAFSRALDLGCNEINKLNNL